MAVEFPRVRGIPSCINLSTYVQGMSDYELLCEVIQVVNKLSELASLSVITYADPLQWNITTQYPQNTVVIDPQTGTAYLSTRPVPAGVQIFNTDYWTKIANIDGIYNQLISAITNTVYEKFGMPAQEAIETGSLVWIDCALYKCVVPVSAGQNIVSTSFIQTTLDAEFENLVEQYKQIIENTTSELNARISNIIANGTQTEGNTELIDIRTGADGKVYPTAGDAVRGQIDGVEEEIAKYTIKSDTIITSEEGLIAPYNDFDTLPTNKIIVYGHPWTNVRNAPAEFSSGTVLTYSYSSLIESPGISQIVLSSNGNGMAYRVKWATGWTEWYYATNVSMGDVESKIINKAVTRDKILTTPESLVAPYDNFDTLPTNKIITISTPWENLNNAPTHANTGVVLTLCWSTSVTGGATQIAIGSNGKYASRMMWGTRWGEWYYATNVSMGDVESKIINKAVTRDKILTTPESLVAPYDNFDTLPTNKIITISTPWENLNNAPTHANTGVVLTLCWSTSVTGGATQIAIGSNGKYASRMMWGTRWGEWYYPSDITKADLEKPYPSIALFEKIGVVGDSWASGYVYHNGKWYTKYNLSWCQQLARRNGVSVTNYAYPGLSTRTWLTSDKGLSLLNSNAPENLYLLCLGLNDFALGDSYIGNPEDMETGADSYYGNYATIIKAIKNKAPNSKIVIFKTNYKGYGNPELRAKFDVADENIASHFEIPLINPKDDSYIGGVDEYDYKNFSNGHPTYYQLSCLSKSYQRLIEKCMYENQAYFNDYVG